MELHPYLQQQEFVNWHNDRGIRITQFSPCGNLNTFYRDVSWAKEETRAVDRLVDHPTLLRVAQKHDRSPVQEALAWGIRGGRSVIPKSTIGWQIRENIDAESIMLDDEDMAAIRTMDQKVRFNDPSPDFGYNLYIGLEGKS